MQRRKFIKNIGALSSAPLLLNGSILSPKVTEDILPMLMNCDISQERSIVVLFLKGGNDGLNTLVPINQFDTYVGHRPDIALAESGDAGIQGLDSTIPFEDQVAIHPRAIALKSMYEAGNARIVQAVGYPNHNRSHFKSTDLWLGGNDGLSDNSLSRDGGWLGRFFDTAYPGVYGEPTVELPDPLGIQLGDSKPSLAFHDHESTYQAVNLSWQNPAQLFGLLSGLGTQPHVGAPGTDYGEKLAHIMTIENSASVYGARITDVYNAGTNSSAVYPDTNLGNDFSTVARLLSGGSKTKVFQLHKDGFDTHGDQVVSGQTNIGTHGDILEDVFDSIKAFHDDLANQGLANKVVTVVFSEFSRRVTQNGSLGTDHGNFGPMFLFGEGINPGITGTNMDISDITENGYLNENQLQYDYRSVFKTLLQDWMGAGDNILNPAELDGFSVMPELITESLKVTPDCYLAGPASCPTDITQDGKTDVEDFIALNSAYGTDCVDCPEDITRDGTVDVEDFIALNSAFGGDCN